MKKLLHYAILMVLFAVSFVSCANYEQYESIAPVSNETELVKALGAYNATLTPSQPSRLGFWGWLSVAGADAVGAYHGAKIGISVGSFLGPHGAAIGGAVGGLLVGTAASYHSHEYLTRSSDEDNTWLFNTTIVNYGNIKNNDIFRNDNISILYEETFDTIATRVAVQHNIILDNIRNSKNDLKNIDLSIFSADEIAIINNEDFRASFESIVPMSYDYKLFSVEDEGDRVMNLFMEAVERAGNSLPEITQIINDYIHIIEISESMSILEREALYTAFTVAAYSYDYWSNYENAE